MVCLWSGKGGFGWELTKTAGFWEMRLSSLRTDLTQLKNECRLKRKCDYDSKHQYYWVMQYAESQNLISPFNSFWSCLSRDLTILSMLTNELQAHNLSPNQPGARVRVRHDIKDASTHYGWYDSPTKIMYHGSSWSTSFGSSSRVIEEQMSQASSYIYHTEQLSPAHSLLWPAGMRIK